MMARKPKEKPYKPTRQGWRYEKAVLDETLHALGFAIYCLRNLPETGIVSHEQYQAHVDDLFDALVTAEETDCGAMAMDALNQHMQLRRGIPKQKKEAA